MGFDMFCELLSGLEPFSGSETGPRRPPIGAKNCPTSYVCRQKNNRALLDHLDGALPAIPRKSLKKRLLERGEAPNSTTFGTSGVIA